MPYKGKGNMDSKTSDYLTVLKNLCSTTALTASTALFLAAPAMSQAASEEGFSYDMGLEVATEDNVYLQDSNETSSTVTDFTAVGTYNLKNPSNEINLAISGNIGGYNVDRNDNYMDIVLGGNALAYTSKKTTIFGSVNYALGHDKRGEGRMDIATVATTPDVYSETELTAGFGYGVDKAGSPRAEFEVGLSDKEYGNNRTTTYLSDLKKNKGKATLFYKLQPSTALLVEATRTQFNYISATLDSTETNIMAGVTWEITGQTSGTVKAGGSSKDFDDSAIADGKTSSWEISANWAPRSYSNFTFSSTRDFDESKGTGDYSEATGTSLNWNHGWNEQLTSNLSLSSAEFDYINSIRSDSLSSALFNIDYKLLENLNMGLGLSTSRRNSNIAGMDYSNNRISAKISLRI